MSCDLSKRERAVSEIQPPGSERLNRNGRRFVVAWRD
jgi:hypothetical protein